MTICLSNLKPVTHITILGKPHYQKRARVVSKPFTRMYDPCSSEKKNLIKMIKSSVDVEGYVEYLESTPFKATMEFIYSRPKSHLKKDGSLRKGYNESHTTKPDIDNIVKFYLDVGNELLYDDDKNCIEVNASKRYGKTERVIICLYKEF